MFHILGAMLLIDLQSERCIVYKSYFLPLWSCDRDHSYQSYRPFQLVAVCLYICLSIYLSIYITVCYHLVAVNFTLMQLIILVTSLLNLVHIWCSKYLQILTTKHEQKIRPLEKILMTKRYFPKRFLRTCSRSILFPFLVLTERIFEDKFFWIFLDQNCKLLKALIHASFEEMMNWAFTIRN